MKKKVRLNARQLMKRSTARYKPIEGITAAATR
jgi:hypothetical protein